jgi:hypothetical protein
MPDVPRDLLERLYVTPPDRFVAARDEAVAAARRAGDSGLAREIAKLRKPTVAAWLVNLLAIRRPELMGELAALSGELRAAQRELQGAQLRELSAQRRTVVAALIGEARTLARQAGEGAGRLPLTEVEETLTAALAEPEVAEQVRSGRLVRPVRYAGFGEVPRPQLRLVTSEPSGPAPESEPAKTRAARSRRAEQAARQALERELAEARKRERKAETELERARAAERDADRALVEIETALADLERRRALAEEELFRRKLARKAAEREAAAARRRTGEAQAAVEALAHDG